MRKTLGPGPRASSCQVFIAPGRGAGGRWTAPGMRAACLRVNAVAGRTLGGVRGLWFRTPWVRRRLARRARRALRRASHVLFVCRGNICRSPFAERFARRQFGPGRVFRSAGYCPVDDQGPASGVSAAALKWDVQLSGHYARGVTATLIRETDAVFVFDSPGYERLLREHPACAPRLHLLGALCAGPPWIDDPFGPEMADIEATYARIVQAIESAAVPARRREAGRRA